MKRFDILPHAGDMAVRACGSTRRELLHALMEGMFTAAAPRPSEEKVDEGPPPLVERPFGLHGSNLEFLIVNILNEAIFSAASYGEVYFDIGFSLLTDKAAEGVLIGRPVAGFDIELKAATHHDLKVTRRPDGLLETTVTFDV
jgi:SHS2 domain-containing protein